MTTPVLPCIQWPGSKVRMASTIVGLLGDHDVYAEPYFGSGAVLLAKPRVGGEIINDINDDVVNFYSILRDAPEELIAACGLTPCAEIEMARAEYDPELPPLERARRFYVRSCQGYGGPNGGWVPTAAASNNLGLKWVRRIGRMAPVAERLQGVQITHRDALDVLRRVVDIPTASTYLDPPYLPDTLTHARHYESDEGLSPDHHTEMLKLARDARGTVVISGYAHPMYEEALTGWDRHEVHQDHTGSPTANGTRARRVEVLWVNRTPARLF